MRTKIQTKIRTETRVDTAEMLYSALNNLIDASQSMKTNFIDQLIYIPWLRDFCTIKLQAARRTGHDSCIQMFIEDHPNKKFLIIHPMLAQMNYFKENLNSSNCYLASAQNTDSCRGLADIDYVIVNNASFIKKENLDKIYNFAEPYAANNRDFLIILIG